MHLYDRNFNCLYRVRQRNGRMRVCAGIQHEGVIRILSLLNPIHQIPFVVGLETVQRNRIVAFPQPVQKAVKREFSVNMRFPFAGQIQIGAVDDLYFFIPVMHHPAPLNCSLIRLHNTENILVRTFHVMLYP